MVLADHEEDHQDSKHGGPLHGHAQEAIAGESKLFHGALESEQALAELGKQVRMRPSGSLAGAKRLARMQVVTADFAEENLANT